MSGPVQFKNLKGVSTETLAVLHSKGFTQATPVQEAVVPLFCGNKDVAVDAATGSGKTLAFVIPVVERLRKRENKPKPHEVIAMVISPTRELSKQIHDVAEPFVHSVPGYSLCLLVGGTDVQTEVSDVKQHGANVVIGTPGRILDVMTRLPLQYKSFEVLVLDEADRLLEMGFQKQLDAIMAKLPKQRRTGLFSATQTDAVEALVRAGLRNPFRVNVAVSAAAAAGAAAAQKTPTTLRIQYLLTESAGKLSQLMALLLRERDKKAIVYFLTCASVEFFAAVLPRLPGADALSFLALHGHMKHNKRLGTLATFAAQPAGVLLCTDLAARGLDIPDVNWILQFDPPQKPEAFVHRVGRTARMGRSGDALVMLLPHEKAYVDLLTRSHVPLSPCPALERAADMAPHVKQLTTSDRDIMEKGIKAFVAYVRGYDEYHYKSIFNFRELDINLLAQVFGLLRLPVMKEIRKKPKGMADFQISDVDPESVPYADPAREKQRQKQLAAASAAGRDKATLKAERLKQRQQKAEAAAKEAAAKKLPAAKRQKLQRREEYECMNDDYALLVKAKKRKISEREYDISIGLVSKDDDGDDSHRELGGDSDSDADDAVRSDCNHDDADGGARAGDDGPAASGKGSSRTAKKRCAKREKSSTCVVAHDGVGADADRGGRATDSACPSTAGGKSKGEATVDTDDAAKLKRKLKKRRLKANAKKRKLAQNHDPSNLAWSLS